LVIKPFRFIVRFVLPLRPMSRVARVIITLIIIPLSFANGQNQVLIKEIKQKLQQANDQEMFNLMNDLAWEYRFAYPDSTIYFANQAYELGKALKLKTGLSRPLNYIGVAYDKKGEPINSYDKYVQAFTLAEQQADSSQIAYSNNNIGRLLADQGVHSKALEYFLKARIMFEALGDSSGLAYVFQSIGRINESQRDFKNGEQNFLTAYQLRVKLGNTRDIMAALVYLGSLTQKSGDLQKSLIYFKKADSAGHVINDRINLAEIKILLAKNFLLTDNLDSAQILSAEGLQVITGQNAKRTLPDALLVRGQVLLRMGNVNEARKFFMEGLKIATQIKELDVKMEAHYHLWKLAEKSGNGNESLIHYNQYLIIQDTLKDLEVTRSLERFQFENEIQRREMESRLVKTQAESQVNAARLQNIILSVVSFFTVLVAFIFWRNNKKKQESNQKLLDQNHKLEDLNHEKDTLMNIVAHDLKSPLNRIRGLIQLMEMDKSPEGQAKYLDIIKRTAQSGLTLIGDLLDLSAVSESLTPRHEDVAVHVLINEKIEAYKEAAQAKNITILKLNPDILVVHSDGDFIKRIVDNLLSNSIKFSHPNSRVSINYGEGQSQFFISVKDNGPGFSDKDKTQLYQKFRRLSAQPTASESSNGLGLALIKSLVDRLNGSIELVSEERKGSEFIITLPNKTI
jgi:signal transduction histidine kinase/Tfp pilus assembly protein PilF